MEIQFVIGLLRIFGKMTYTIQHHMSEENLAIAVTLLSSKKTFN